MIKKRIIVDNTITDVIKITKKTISQLKGKIVFHDETKADKCVYKWDYNHLNQIISFRTLIKPFRNKVTIETSVESETSDQLNETFLVDYFHNQLFLHPKIKGPNTNDKNEDDIGYLDNAESKNTSQINNNSVNKLKETKVNKSRVTKIENNPNSLPYIILFVVIFLIFCFTQSGGCSNNFGSENNQTKIENNPLDNSVYQVEHFLKKEYLKDPDSYESINWSKVIELNENKFMVRHKFRARNGYGGYSIEEKIFYLDGQGNIIDISDVE